MNKLHWPGDRAELLALAQVAMRLPGQEVEAAPRNCCWYAVIVSEE